MKRRFKMRNKTIALFLSVIATPAFAQSIVGTWDCTNWDGFRYTMILNADNTVTAGTPAGSFSGRYALRGNSLVCSFTGLPVPSTNVITRRDQNSFESYPANDPRKKETCRRIDASVTTSCAVKGKCLSGDCANGTGTLLDSDGIRYEGAFKNCAEDGHGVLTPKDGSVSIEGTFSDGGMDRNGPVIMRFPNGMRLEGNMINGQVVRGTLLWPDGAKYVGEFNGKKQFVGKGTLTYANGDVFTGQFYGGTAGDPLASAQGLMAYADGGRYEGGFEHGQRSGQGTYVWKSGFKYVGSWRNGQRNGQGILYDSDGTVSAQGEFVDDQSPATADPLKGK